MLSHQRTLNQEVSKDWEGLCDLVGGSEQPEGLRVQTIAGVRSEHCKVNIIKPHNPGGVLFSQGGEMHRAAS